MPQIPVHKEEDKKDLIEPKTRAAGGVWLSASDFPFCFQHIIIYHNVTKFSNVQFYEDKWVDASQPYICNEKDIYLKLELDEEALKQQNAQANQQYGAVASLDISKQSAVLQQSMNQDHSMHIDESKIEGGLTKFDIEHNILPGEVPPLIQQFDQILIGFKPNPTKQTYPILPRYLLRLHQLDLSSLFNSSINTKSLEQKD